MKGWLRSWKLCDVSPAAMDGVSGWQKRRLKRAACLIPPGNVFLNAIDSGCRMLGAGWAEQEVSVFRRTHSDMPPPLLIDKSTIWLPHLSGVELSTIAGNDAVLSAFTELGRFHRLDAISIHGDPHAGNFLYDRTTGRCRIIDFETGPTRDMEAAEGRARDFAILALDLWKVGCGSVADLDSWREAYGEGEEFCPIDGLFRSPGFRLRHYWKCLGYFPPESARR